MTDVAPATTSRIITLPDTIGDLSARHLGKRIALGVDRRPYGTLTDVRHEDDGTWIGMKGPDGWRYFAKHPHDTGVTWPA